MTDLKADLHPKLESGESLADSLLELFLEDHKQGLLQEGDLKIFHPNTPLKTREEFVEEIKAARKPIENVRGSVSELKSVLDNSNTALVGIDKARASATKDDLFAANYPKLSEAGLSREDLLNLLNDVAYKKIERAVAQSSEAVRASINATILALEPLSKKSVHSVPRELLSALKDIKLEEGGENLTIRLDVGDPQRDKIFELVGPDSPISKFFEFVDNIPSDAAGREAKVEESIQEARNSYKARREDVATDLEDFERGLKTETELTTKIVGQYLLNSLKFLFDPEIDSKKAELLLAKVETSVDMLGQSSKEERHEAGNKIRVQIEAQIPIPGLVDKLLEDLETKIQGKEGWLEGLKSRIDREVPEIKGAEIGGAAAAVVEEVVSAPSPSADIKAPTADEQVEVVTDPELEATKRYLMKEFGFSSSDALSLSGLVDEDSVMEVELALIEGAGLSEEVAKKCILANPELLITEKDEVISKQTTLKSRVNAFNKLLSNRDLSLGTVIPSSLTFLLNASNADFAVFLGQFSLTCKKLDEVKGKLTAAENAEALGRIELLSPDLEPTLWSSNEGLKKLNASLSEIELIKGGNEPPAKQNNGNGKAKKEEFDKDLVSSMDQAGAPNPELALAIYLYGFQEGGHLVTGNRRLEANRIKRSVGVDRLTRYGDGKDFDKCLAFLVKEGLLTESGAGNSKEYSANPNESSIKNKNLHPVKARLFSKERG